MYTEPEGADLLKPNYRYICPYLRENYITTIYPEQLQKKITPNNCIRFLD